MHALIGMGIDIVDIDRMRLARYPERVMEFFLTESELTDARRAADPVQFAASRFAAKEAVIKAFPKRLKPLDFEIVRNAEKLGVRFLDAEAQKYSAYLSISHVPHYAVGYACVMTH